VHKNKFHKVATKKASCNLQKALPMAICILQTFLAPKLLEGFNEIVAGEIESFKNKGLLYVTA
jgi:hypothetical protein